MRQPCDHGIKNQAEEYNTQPEEKVAEGSGNTFPAEPFVTNAEIIEFPFAHQSIVPTTALMQHFVFGDPPGEDDGIHGKFFDAEVRIEEMD